MFFLLTSTKNGSKSSSATLFSDCSAWSSSNNRASTLGSTNLSPADSRSSTNSTASRLSYPAPMALVGICPSSISFSASFSGVRPALPLLQNGFWKPPFRLPDCALLMPASDFHAAWFNPPYSDINRPNFGDLLTLSTSLAICLSSRALDAASSAVNAADSRSNADIASA